MMDERRENESEDEMKMMMMKMIRKLKLKGGNNWIWLIHMYVCMYVLYVCMLYVCPSYWTWEREILKDGKRCCLKGGGRGGERWESWRSPSFASSSLIYTKSLEKKRRETFIFMLYDPLSLLPHVIYPFFSLHPFSWHRQYHHHRRICYVWYDWRCGLWKMSVKMMDQETWKFSSFLKHDPLPTIKNHIYFTFNLIILCYVCYMTIGREIEWICIYDIRK